VSLRRACSEWHLHCRHLLAFFAGGWRVRAELDQFGIGTFLGGLLNRPDDLSSASSYLLLRKLPPLQVLNQHLCIGVRLWAFYSLTVFGTGLLPTFEAFFANSLLASADRASYSNLV
jgi:hypothetical protein